MPASIQIRVEPKYIEDLERAAGMALRQAGISNGKAILRKKSLDARGKNPIYILTFDVLSTLENAEIQPGFTLQNVSNCKEVHIIGAGPAGLFAALQLIELGLKPVIIERGKKVKDRRRDLKHLIDTGIVNPDSNYCFGEGGAGTYSDGKLYTRSSKRGPVTKVLQTFCDFGAVENILYDAHPHIGTNKLPGIIENIRNAITDCGGEIHFGKRVTGFHMSAGKMDKIVCGNESFTSNTVILATGHSARDIFELLNRENVAIEAKAFAIGLRIEHPQTVIDTMQYHCDIREENLPAASYNLVEQVKGRGVFSFCMCPGGIIAPAATATGEIVVNGWSPSKRNGPYANSGFVVTVDEHDFAPFHSHGALKAMAYQAHYEKLAYTIPGSLKAPAQRMEDFIQGKNSTNLPGCSYIPGIVSTNLENILATEIMARIKEALIILGKKKHGYRTNEAVLVGVESRTSSPVKIPRLNDKLTHVHVLNLYPCGEGAGYAGGIMSAALDGMRVATAILQNQ